MTPKHRRVRHFFRRNAWFEGLEKRLAMAADLGGHEVQSERLDAPPFLANGYYDVDVLADGRYLLSSREQIVRHHLDGMLDTTFGVAGAVAKQKTGDGSFAETLVQSDGKIIYLDDLQQSIFRINSDGSADSSFGTDGAAHVDGLWFDMTILMNDKILASSIVDGQFFLVRLDANGHLDESFGTHGRVHLKHPEYELRRFGRYSADELSEPDRRIFSPIPSPAWIIPGSPGGDGDAAILISTVARRAGGEERAVLFQLDSAGAFDDTFGVVDLGSAFHGWNEWRVALDNQGRILAALRERSSDVVQLRRFLPNGTPDAAFSPDISPSGIGYIALVPDPGNGFLILGKKDKFKLQAYRYDHQARFDAETSQQIAEQHEAGTWLDPYVERGPDGAVYLFSYEQSEPFLTRITTADTPQAADPVVAFRLEATDSDGLPLTSISAGKSFVVNVYAEDLRAVPQGVFAAYVDVFFHGAPVAPVGAIGFGAEFSNGQSGEFVASVLDEVGGFGGLDLPPSGEQLLFTTTVRAAEVGEVSLRLGPADLSPIHDVLLRGRAAAPVVAHEVVYGSLHLDVLPIQWQNTVDKYDVDGDGVDSALDALAVVNDINLHGARLLPETVDADYYYLDVNGNGYVSAADVLEIVDMLNGGSMPAPARTDAEGEAVFFERQSEAVPSNRTRPPTVDLIARDVIQVQKTREPKERSLHAAGSDAALSSGPVDLADWLQEQDLA